MIAQKRDANEGEIIDTLTAAGADFIRMDRTAGFDLLVLFRGRVYLAEVKNPALRWHLTDAEKAIQRRANYRDVTYYILQTPADVINMLDL